MKSKQFTLSIPVPPSVQCMSTLLFGQDHEQYIFQTKYNQAGFLNCFGLWWVNMEM